MKRARPAILWALVLGATALGGCAPKARPAISAPAPGIAPVERLRSDLDRFFGDHQFAQAQWGVLLVSLDRGDILFERDPARLLVPASNNKIVTAAAALLRLGPDFRYETRLRTDGIVQGEVVTGNLIVEGAGDPSVAPRFLEGDAFRVFREWAARLKEQGIRRIAGDLVADDRAFEETTLGQGWEWDDLAFGYAAPVTALQFNESVATLEIAPAEKAGEPARVRAIPLSQFLAVSSSVTTGPEGSESRVRVERGAESRSVVLTGAVPRGGSPVTRNVAVDNPSEYFLFALRHVLEQEGVDVSACGLRSMRRSASGEGSAGKTLLSHRSPTLSEILQPLMKVSQNLYSETMTKTLGLVLRGEGSFQKGREVVEETLRTMAIEPGTYRYADGSGLSRHNLVSPDLLIRILRFMYRHPHFEAFYQALPVAGVDGTLSGRLKGTAAERNVRAKTGTVAGVRSLSGYVRTADGEMLAFSMIANNFLVPTRAADYVQDRVLERLANFSR